MRADTHGLSAIIPDWIETLTIDMDYSVNTETAEYTNGRVAERRQLTVMFCDLVDSTGLSERLDPEELSQLILTYREVVGSVVKKYQGHVQQHQGDGLMVYFGWPSAHEDDAERSARAAIEILHEVKNMDVITPLQVRIGVATGEVAVGSEDAFGATPNLASRLQGLADSNEIVIANETRQLVGETFELVDLGNRSLKGITRPVHVWRVLGMGHAVSRFEASRGNELTPLVGREEEIGLLLDRHRIATRNEGQVVVLSGEPGIGKSRVLNELNKYLEAQDVQPLRFQCSPYHTNSAYWPSIDHIERVLQYTRNEAPDAKLDKLEALLVGEYGLPLSDVCFIAAILSIPCEARYGPISLTPQKHKDETQRTLVDLAEAAALKQPSVLFFEDVHWADDTTLEVLDLFVERVKNLPLLIVLSHRPEFETSWCELEYVETIDLARLTLAQSRKIVVQLSQDKALPEDLIEQILTKTDGVPLFVEELTKFVLESGKLKDVGDHYTYLSASHGIATPPTVRDSLMARLDQHEQAKEIAQIGAVIGREFSYELVSAVALFPVAELEDKLERLTVSGLAYQKGTPPDATYTFKHALVQDVAYVSLTNSRRRQLHARIAQTIEARLPHIIAQEPEVLAHHYTQASMFEQGSNYWCLAGQNALDKWALTDAIAHLKIGLDVIKSMPDSSTRELECRVLLSTAWEAYRGWAAPQLAEVLEPALPLARVAQKSELLARTLWGLWVQRMSVGPVAESLAWAEELLSAGNEKEDEELLLVGHMAVMVTNFWLGNPLEVKKHAHHIIELYDQDRHSHIVLSMNHDPKTLAGIYLSQVLWMLGYPDQAEAIVDERDAHARLIGHPFDSAFALTLGAWVYHYRREPVKQYSRNDEVQELARIAGLPFISHVLGPYLSTGMSLAQQGRLSEGIKDMRKGLESWEEAGAKTVTPYIRSLLGEALALSGDVDTGLSYVDEMLEQISTFGWEERSHLAEILRLKGWMQSLKGDLVGAEHSYLKSLDWAREQQTKSWELRTMTSLARLWLAQGRGQESYERLAEIYNWFEEGFETNDLVEAKVLLEELST